MADLSSQRRGLLGLVRAHAQTPVSDAVADALWVVPRHLFLPDVPPATAYQDDAIVTKVDAAGQPISSSSQPTIMALMLDQLGLAPGHRVLEIGAGTGYNAALMAHLVGPDGSVVSLDIDADLVEQARRNLTRAGYPAVTVIQGDGAQGYEDRAPYDRIIATVGVWDLAPAWLSQLAPDGRILVPLDLGGLQRSVAFEAADGHLASRSVVPCGFMRLRGPFAGPERTHILDDGLRLVLPDGGDLDTTALLAATTDPPVRVPTGVTATTRDLFAGVGLWLAINGQHWCMLSEPAPSRRFGAGLAVIHDHAYSAGLVSGSSLAVLTAEDTLVALGYGPDGDRLATTLARHLRSWATAGFPGRADLRVDAYPASTPDSVIPAQAILPKTHTKLAISWPA
jgi:protein-L-isoaspartate(D-aspartate) O-methyltransferase